MEDEIVQQALNELRQGKRSLRIYEKVPNRLMTLLVLVAAAALLLRKGTPTPGAAIVLIILVLLASLALSRLFAKRKPILILEREGVTVPGLPIVDWRKIKGIHLGKRRYQGSSGYWLMLYVPTLREYLVQPEKLRKLEYALRGVRGERRIEVPLSYADLGAERLYRIVELYWEEYSGNGKTRLRWSPSWDDDEYEAIKKSFSATDELMADIDKAMEEDRPEGVLAQLQRIDALRKERKDVMVQAHERREKANVRGAVFTGIILVLIAAVIVLTKL